MTTTFATEAREARRDRAEQIKRINVAIGQAATAREATYGQGLPLDEARALRAEHQATIARLTADRDALVYA